MARQHSFIAHIDCRTPDCPVCAGKVKNCVVCGGSHSEFVNTLTTECHGKPLKHSELNKIAAGELDLKGGYFRNPKDGPAIDEVMDLKLGTVATHASNKKRYIYIGGHMTSRGTKSHNFHPEIVNFSNRADDYISVVYSEQLFKTFPSLRPQEGA